MLNTRLLRCLCWLNLLCASVAMIAGCAKEPPPPTKMQIEEGIKQNDANRERERSNQ